jgi:protein-S-isoprenylcysteine O-methyltransferase Ste14
VIIESVEIELNQKKYVNSVRDAINVGEVRDFVFSVQTPHIPGSYILRTTVRYLNEGVLLTVKHADFYHNGQPALLSESCRLEPTNNVKGLINLTAPQGYPWSLIVPDEIEVRKVSTHGNSSIYQASSTLPGFTTVNQIFTAAEVSTENVHQATFCGAVLTLSHGKRFPIKGWFPGYVFVILAIIFYALCSVLILMRRQKWIYHIMLRYGSRIFFLSISCWILKEIDQWLFSSMNFLSWNHYQNLARILLDNINGGNYRYFFQFFLDGYYVLCLLFIFPCLYFFDSQRPASQDKYVASFTTILALPRLFVWKKPFWNDLSKLCLLTIMVKFFFTPVMVSWAIGSAYNMVNGIRSFQWNVYAVNAYLVQLLILVDTVIFSLGYLVESKYLKNEIKSVDPTFFGWLVCLWCYPPFNAFSFKPLDYYLIRISLSYPTWLTVIVLCAITCLWGVFVWASVSLGFKASNLTNRGIVRSGPYRFARHPAYMAKLMIWILQGIFFAQFGIFILLGFIIVYVLRAWTEERHLSRDPDYLAYKQVVRWWFIPGVV